MLSILSYSLPPGGDFVTVRYTSGADADLILTYDKLAWANVMQAAATT